MWVDVMVFLKDVLLEFLMVAPMVAPMVQTLAE